MLDFINIIKFIKDKRYLTKNDINNLHENLQNVFNGIQTAKRKIKTGT